MYDLPWKRNPFLAESGLWSARPSGFSGNDPDTDRARLKDEHLASNHLDLIILLESLFLRNIIRLPEKSCYSTTA